MPAGPLITVYLAADGRAALVPLSTSNDGPIPASVTLRIGDDLDQPTPVWWLTPGPAAVFEDDSPILATSRMRDWLGQPTTWSAAPVPMGPAAPVGRGIAAVTVPAGAGIAGSRVRIDGADLKLRWIAPQSGRFDFAAPHPRPDAENPWLTAALQHAKSQPGSAWRARIALPDARFASAPSAAPDSVASRLAEQRAEIWAVAMQRLARTDRETARRLAIRIGGVIDFGDGVAAPVWLAWPGPDNADDGLGLLLADLLADDLTEPERADRAAAWLNSLPAGAAWVIDDAGLRDAASTSNIATLALVNLTDLPAAASVAIDGASVPLEMLTIKPMSMVKLRVPMRRAEADRGSARKLAIRIGPWRGQATVLGDAVPARPPGIPIVPLLRDISMPVIAASAETGQCPLVTPDADGLTAGMLLRTPVEPAKASPARFGNWTVYLECMRSTTSATAAQDDVVRIFFGPPDAPAAVWRVGLNGQAVLESGTARADPTLAVTRTLQSDRWLLWAPVPAAAIEPDGRLRLGIVRERRRADNSIERTAWPRALLPWQNEAGRITVDLTAWDRSEPR